MRRLAKKNDSMSDTMNKLREVAEDMGLTFRVETWARANLIADNVTKEQLPLCIAIQPIKGTISIDAYANYRDIPSVFVGFADRLPLDFQGEEAEEVAERMKGKAVEFISRVNDSGFFEEVSGDIAYDVSFNRLDATLLIFSVELPLRPLASKCL